MIFLVYYVYLFMIRIPLDNLKQLLIESGLVKDVDFSSSQREAERTGRDVTEILVSRGFVTQEYLDQILSSYYHAPLANLVGEEISPDVLNIIPEDIARARNAVVFARDNDKLKVAVMDPSDLETIKFLEGYTQKQLMIYFATERDLQYAFSQYRKEILENFQRSLEDQMRYVNRMQLGQVSDLAKAATEVPIVAIVDNLISYGAALNATDIHIEVLADALLIRFRIDGILREVARLSVEIHPAIIARIKILSGMQIDEHAKPQDGRLKYKRGNEMFDIRVATMPTFYGEKITMRLLLAGAKPLSFAELGMTPDQVATIEKNIKKTFGMVLSTGPTSSGKTTTQYSILSFLNKPEVNIVTIEDPIEYELRFVNQTQVNVKAGITFASGLRAFLRHDPNIVMVGEIRDNETADIATNAALTGHLVLSTLHTNDASTAVPRLIDMGVPPFLVSATLNVIMAQRLVRKVCAECIESYTPEQTMEDSIREQLAVVAPDTAKSYKLPTILYHGKGCKACNWKGYLGRVAIFEILDVDADIRTYIANKDFTLDGLRKLMATKGMKTMFEDGLHKAEMGMTTLEEVFRVIRE